MIPTHNGWELVERCLESLRSQTVEHAVFVVDNGSSDGTATNVQGTFTDVHVVEMNRNAGFSVACNRGASAGKGDIIVLLNNDVEALPDFVEQLVDPLVSSQRIGSVASLLVRPGGQVIDSFGLSADPTLAGFPRLRGRPVRDAGLARAVLAGPCGAAGAYRRAAWEEVGGLDEGVLGYGEDLDLALRLRSAGWSAAANSGAIAIHVGSASFGRRSARQRYQGGFARGYFLRRYGVLRSRHTVRALATEAIVAGGDVLLSRDMSAVKGRRAGWRAAKGAPRRPLPPREAVDQAITFRESMRLRRRVYAT